MPNEGSKQAIREFVAYLLDCTDAQVQGVYDKEKAAGRVVYTALAVSEAARRGIELTFRKPEPKPFSDQYTPDEKAVLDILRRTEATALLVSLARRGSDLDRADFDVAIAGLTVKGVLVRETMKAWDDKELEYLKLTTHGGAVVLGLI